MRKILLVVCILLTNALKAQTPETNGDLIALILKHQKGLQTSDMAEMRLSSSSTDKKTGVAHYYFIQYYKSIPVHNAVLGLHLDAGGNVLTLNHTFYKNIASVTAGAEPKTEAPAALLNAMNSKQATSGISGNIPSAIEVSRNGSKIIYRNESVATGDITVHLCWLPIKGELKLCWNVNWLTKDGQNWWNIRVSAESGTVLDENNWMNQCNASGFENRNHHITLPDKENSDESATVNGNSNSKYNVFAMPVESPNHGNRSILTDPSDSLASPYNWHDVDGFAGNEFTITRGNNVYAYEDTLNFNSPGYSPEGGTNLDFDYPFDISQPHPQFLDASITNLFYWNNIMHDVWYQYGFDDASGNFQVNNYGRGGDGNDEVMAEAQDGSGKNNANFGTPPDGMNPRMQMYNWMVNYPDYMLRITQPSSAAAKFLGLAASFGPVLTTTPITGNLVLADDGSSNPSQACNWLINGSDLNGQIALIDRGTCFFGDKIINAQNSGAVAVIMVNNVDSDPIIMTYNGSGIYIPSIMVSKATGDSLKKAMLSNTVEVSLYDSAGVEPKMFDSDFDNGIICHEYGHGISNRLTGGPAVTDCLQNAEQMGEGWSDFFALVMTCEQGDSGTDKRGMGTYSQDKPVTGNGIRAYPYSTDMSVNPLTYDYIKTHPEVHDLGTVWCAMLWDLYWELTNQYGYDKDIYKGKGGNNMAMQLVIDGMKLQPCSPGFVDGRDAILLADQINNQGKNQPLIWKTFARRGLGYSADQGSSDDVTDGAEAFDFPELPQIFMSGREEAHKGDTVTYKIALKNKTSNPLQQFTITDTIHSGLQFIRSTTLLPDTLINNVYSANVNLLNVNDSIVFEIITKVVSPNASAIIETSDFEKNAGSWKDSTLDGSTQWGFNTIKKHSGNKSYYIPNDGLLCDEVLVKTFDLNLTSPHLVFYHMYNTESNSDGGVVEIFNNGVWQDLGPRFIENGYNALINPFGGSGLSNRMAFTGNSGKFIRSAIDLTPYKGKAARIRFRFASDNFMSADGWYIDDISLAGSFISINNRIVVKANNGNSSSRFTTTWLVDTGSNINHIEITDNFKILPNPFSDALNIQTAEKNYEITISDILGKVVLKTGKLNDNQTLQTSSLPSGTYILKLETPNGTEVVKLVKCNL